MANTPPVDKVTIVDKGFGKYGVPIDSTGGITMSPQGATITPFINAGFVEIDPVIYTSIVNKDKLNSETLKGIRTFYRKQGRLIDFLFIWFPTTNFVFDEDWNTLSAPLSFGLPVVPEHATFMGEYPFDMDDPNFFPIMHPLSTTGLMVNHGVKDWGGIFPSVLADPYGLDFISLIYNNSGTWSNVTTNAPFHLRPGDRMYFHFQYISET